MKIKNILYSILFLSTVFVMNACDDKPEIPGDDTYEAPEPPAAINNYNLFTMEFYSRLTEEPLFGTVSYDAVVSRLSSNQTNLAYLFDRSDITIGQTSAVVDIAWKSKKNAFFVQNNTADNVIEGTGMIVRQLVPVFPGTFNSDSLFIAGCALSAPLYTTTPVTLLTCKLKEDYQIKILSGYFSQSTSSNKVVVGTMLSGMEDTLRDYLKHHLKNFRIAVLSSTQTGKAYKIFILSPVNFVCRGFQELTVGEFPMYQIKIEYLN